MPDVCRGRSVISKLIVIIFFTKMIRIRRVDNARDHDGKFLSLWKNADPGIAKVEEARRRLAGLKGR
jgi:hypothetical protein